MEISTASIVHCESERDLYLPEKTHSDSDSTSEYQNARAGLESTFLVSIHMISTLRFPEVADAQMQLGKLSNHCVSTIAVIIIVRGGGA